jgi:hypothetical protein
MRSPIPMISAARRSTASSTRAFISSLVIAVGVRLCYLNNLCSDSKA